MTQLIRLLPSDVINQIAAGEVVERPASVVKELIENSLDSGATQVEVSLIGGGLDQIQVIDNGSGISPLDLPLAVQRHATSKLKLASDLESIDTFGFRGEALSSICSVARVTLTSRTQEAPMGYQLNLDEGVFEGGLQMIAAPLGTQVVVSSLFCNTPARRKFLRSQHTELSHCQKIVREIALGNPGIRFTLRNENRTLATYLSASRRDRFRECLKLPWSPMEIRETRDEMSLEAYFSPPEHSAARSELYLFINGRPVRHRPFLSAIRTAFLETWGSGREPIGACYLDIRRDWVDVNVHPQKWEVRCFQQESIYHWLLLVFRRSLLTNKTSDSSVRQTRVPSFNRHAGSPPKVEFEKRPVQASEPHPFLFLFKNERFLVCEDKQGLIIAQMDSLAAAVEMRNLRALKREGKWPVDTLDLPRICRLPEELRPVTEQYRDFLVDWGFHSDNFGDGDFAIRTHPSFLPDSLADAAFSELVDCLSSPGFAEEITACPDKLIRKWIQFRRERGLAPEPLSLGDLLDELAHQVSQPGSQSPAPIHRVAYLSDPNSEELS